MFGHSECCRSKRELHLRVIPNVTNEPIPFHSCGAIVAILLSNLLPESSLGSNDPSSHRTV